MSNESEYYSPNTGKFDHTNTNSYVTNQPHTPYNSTPNGLNVTNQSNGAPQINLQNQNLPNQSYPTQSYPNQSHPSQNLPNNNNYFTHNQKTPTQSNPTYTPSSGVASKDDMREMLGIFSDQIMVRVETVISSSLGEVNAKLVQQDANLSNLRDQLLHLKQEVHQGFATSKQEIEVAREESRKAVEIAKQAKDTRGGFRGRNNLSVLHVSGWKIETDGNPFLPKRSHDLPAEFFEVFAKIEKVDARRCNLYAKEGFTFYQLSWTMARSWGRFLNYCPDLDIRSLAERNLNKTMADKPVFADMRPWAEVKKGRIILEAEDF